MELEYYYSVITMTETYTGNKFLICLTWGKTLNELAADIFNFLDRSLKKSVEGFNELYGNNLDFNDPELAGKCSNKGFGIAPIIALRQKWKSGKELTFNDFKNIDFYNNYDGSMSVYFSNIPTNIRDLRDLLASSADVFGFYDELPSDYELETSEEKLVNVFFELSKKWVASHS